MSPNLWTPQPHPAAGTAQRGQTRLIEPGSFIYTVKVTSNFLRLSCSSAIKSWRGQEQPPGPPGEGTPGAAPPGTRSARGACAIASETWLLQVIASEGFVFILLPIFLVCFVSFCVFFLFGHPLLFLSRTRNPHTPQSTATILEHPTSVCLPGQPGALNNALETQFYWPNRLC